MDSIVEPSMILKKRKHPSLPYRDEIVGCRIAVLLKEKESHSCDFFEGTVERIRVVRKGKSKRRATEHWVQFENGDAQWFDLTEQEKEMRLLWACKKIKVEAGGTENRNETGQEETPLEVSSSESLTKRAAKSTTNLEEQDFDGNDESEAEETWDAVSKDEEQDSDDEISEEEEDTVGKDDDIYADLSSHPIPDTLVGVVRFMDVLEPDQHYYRRQADNRNGCSLTRGRLRKFARENKDHPAVAHWVRTNKWAPPDYESLQSLMELIKTKMITKKA